MDIKKIYINKGLNYFLVLLLLQLLLPIVPQYIIVWLYLKDLLELAGVLGSVSSGAYDGDVGDSTWWCDDATDMGGDDATDMGGVVIFDVEDDTTDMGGDDATEIRGELLTVSAGELFNNPNPKFRGAKNISINGFSKSCKSNGCAFGSPFGSDGVDGGEGGS